MTVDITPAIFDPSKSDPTLRDLLNLVKKEVFLDLNCHHIGTIQKFNLALQTATVTINYKKTFVKLNPATGLYDPYQIAYPTLIDCPVICLGGGDSGLTFPVALGDECLVLFNDRDLENWFLGASNGPVASSRLHSTADAVVLVGLRSAPNVLDNYDPQRNVLRGGTAVLGTNPTNDKVLIANVAPTVAPVSGNISYATTLNTLLQNLITQINAIITTNAVPGNPSLISPASQAALTAVGAQIAGLLE